MLSKLQKEIRRLETAADRAQMNYDASPRRRESTVARADASIRCKRAIAGVLSQLSSMQDQRV